MADRDYPDPEATADRLAEASYADGEIQKEKLIETRDEIESMAQCARNAAVDANFISERQELLTDDVAEDLRDVEAELLEIKQWLQAYSAEITKIVEYVESNGDRRAGVAE